MLAAPEVPSRQPTRPDGRGYIVSAASDPTVTSHACANRLLRTEAQVRLRCFLSYRTIINATSRRTRAQPPLRGSYAQQRGPAAHDPPEAGRRHPRHQDAGPRHHRQIRPLQLRRQWVPVMIEYRHSESGWIEPSRCLSTRKEFSRGPAGSHHPVTVIIHRP